MIRIGIVDDHSLMRDGIKAILTQAGMNVSMDFNSASEVMKATNLLDLDIILMDISMPEMSGVELTKWLGKNYPLLKVVAMTALDDELNIIRMLRAGAKAYFLKSSGEKELVNAITYVHKNGRYYSDLVSDALVKSLNEDGLKSETEIGLTLTDNELAYLKHLCSDMTNKEIADKMHVSPRTSEGWSQKLCDKLNVKSRVGLAAFAFRNNLA